MARSGWSHAANLVPAFLSSPDLRGFTPPSTGSIGLSTNTVWMRTREAFSIEGAPSRSCTDAGCTCNSSPRPSVSTQSVLLAARDLLAGVISTRATGLGGLDALRIDHRGSWAGLAAGTLAIQRHQVMVRAFPGPVVAKPDKPAIHRLMWREVRRQHAPRGMLLRSMKNMALISSRRRGPAGLRRRRKQRRQHLPFRIGQIAGVAQVVPVMLGPVSGAHIGGSKKAGHLRFHGIQGFQGHPCGVPRRPLKLATRLLPHCYTANVLALPDGVISCSALNEGSPDQSLEIGRSYVRYTK